MSKVPLSNHIEALLELAPAAQARYLDQLRAQSPQTADRLQRMLDSAPSVEERLGGLAGRIGSAMPAEIEHAWAAGKHIGPYRLVSVLGVGGMGSVFLAERDDGSFDRQVALKVLPLDLGDPALVARFENERRLLARLQHPAIAQLLDAGISDDGRPYFVMDYVDGLLLDCYCDTHHLGLRERLRLLLSVADAVQYAHQNLVIHRDLKPANILVTPEGQIKLLDFGIARLVGEHTAHVTQGEARWFTPAYAAPEQRSDAAPSTAIDVFSLGVVTYQLLCGALPSRDQKITAPSAAALGGDETTAQLRGLSRRQLQRRLRGDLDVIVSTALALNPEDRYRDVASLREDFSRHLEGLPIRARPTPLLTRVRKFVQRHRSQVAAALLVAIMLTGATAYALMQARQARLERDRAQRISALLVEVFSAADPDQARGRELSARDLLDAGVGPLRNEQDPSLRAPLLAALGRTYRSLGEYPRAVELLDEAAELQRAQGSDQLAQTLFRLGEARMLNGELEVAESLLTEARDRAVVQGGVDHTLTLAIQGKLGRLYERLGRVDQARMLLTTVLERTRAQHSDDHEALAQALNDLAAVALTQGNYAEVEPLLREAIILNRERDRRTSADPANPSPSPRTATLINNLGLVVYFQGRQAAAETLYREALTIRRNLLGADHPDLAQTLTNLGLLLNERGDLQGSTAALEEALAIRRASLPEGHIQIVSGINNLAMVLQADHRPDQAEALYREALKGLSESLGPHHPAVATTESNLASVLFDRGQHAAAEQHFRHSLALRRELHPAGHPYLAYSLVGLGQALVALGRAEEAVPLLDEALTIRATLPAEHWALAEARYAKGFALTEIGDTTQALSLLDQAISALNPRGEDDRHLQRARSYRARAEALLVKR